MRVKYSVFPFIPAFLAMMFLKLMSLYGLDGNGLFLGMNAMNITYTVIGISIGLFVLCVIFNIFDKKTSPVYPVKKNFIAGVLSLLGGASVIAASAARFSAALSNSIDSEYFMMIIICAVFSLPAGIALMLISKVHFQGKSIISNISILFVFPSLWGCAELVSEFLMATKASIYSRDLTSLFCYIFLTLYLFSNSMIVSRIKGRNPVKSCFIYGLPAIAVSVSFGVYEILRLSKEGFEYSALLAAVQFIILGLYAASFIIEMFKNSYTKDELEIIESLPADEDIEDLVVEKKKRTEEEQKRIEQAEAESMYITTKDYDDLVLSERPAESNHHIPDNGNDYYASSKGLDDFIIGYTVDDEDDEPIPYFTKHEKQNKQAPLTVPYQDDELVMANPVDSRSAEAMMNEDAKKRVEAQKAEAEAKRAEEERLAAEAKKAEEERLAAEAKKAEEERLAAEAKRAEEERLAAEAKRAEEERLAAEAKRAEEERLAAEAKKAEEERLAAEAKKAEEEISANVAVNNKLNSSQTGNVKDEDYYERRLEEINNLLKDMDNK